MLTTIEPPTRMHTMKNATTMNPRPEWYHGTCGPQCPACDEYVRENAPLMYTLESALAAPTTEGEGYVMQCEQTGGHCMVVCVYFENHSRPDGRYVMLTDARGYSDEAKLGEYFIASYLNDGSGDDGGTTLAERATIDDLVNIIRRAYADDEWLPTPGYYDCCDVCQKRESGCEGDCACHQK